LVGKIFSKQIMPLFAPKGKYKANRSELRSAYESIIPETKNMPRENSKRFEKPAKGKTMVTLVPTQTASSIPEPRSPQRCGFVRRLVSFFTCSKKSQPSQDNQVRQESQAKAPKKKKFSLDRITSTLNEFRQFRENRRLRRVAPEL